MGYCFTRQGLDALLKDLAQTHLLYAPRRYEGQGAFSDTDSVRYGEIASAEEIELREKSAHTFKDIPLPISETLFFFTEDSVREAGAREKEAIVFLRSCDLHAVKRLDEMYLHNGGGDYYYKRLRDKVRFVLLGCREAFENCFCADMGTNRATGYDASLDERDGLYYMDCPRAEWQAVFAAHAQSEPNVTPDAVDETPTRVTVPENLDAGVITASPMWDEYDARCIACGRCNFSCPTCTCFSMQDIFYTDNGKAGERRRVWASCMVDGFTDVAGGGCYRQKYGQRMRFKVLHKVLDYKQRFGYHMCVGCGRCDDVCPEYISFSSAVNKLAAAQKEVDAQ